MQASTRLGAAAGCLTGDTAGDQEAGKAPAPG